VGWVALHALPHSLDVLGRTFEALRELAVQEQQMSRDLELLVAKLGFGQQLEKTQ
jgi:hypothetical protein